MLHVPHGVFAVADEVVERVVEFVKVIDDEVLDCEVVGREVVDHEDVVKVVDHEVVD